MKRKSGVVSGIKERRGLYVERVLLLYRVLCFEKAVKNWRCFVARTAMDFVVDGLFCTSTWVCHFGLVSAMGFSVKYE